MDLHPDVQALLDAMRKLEQFLVQHGEDFWSAQVRQAADLIAKSDAYGLERFLKLFGGMGSLNDLVLHLDGQWLTAENDHLAALRLQAWDLADQLRREVR